MVREKKRTPRSVERHAANRAVNEARHQENVARLEELGAGSGTYRERPSRMLRAIERAKRFREPYEGPEDAA